MVAVSDSPSSPRREQILREAAQLFARRGFHGVSIVELGAAVGISGPALYRHFPSKEALLARMLIGISERLLAGGSELASGIGDPRELLTALVDFQLDFSLREPELITVQDRDLANLPAEDRRRVRALQRAYVEIWVDALVQLHPGLPAEAARVAAHAVFGLLNSTPHSAVGGAAGGGTGANATPAATRPATPREVGGSLAASGRGSPSPAMGSPSTAPTGDSPADISPGAARTNSRTAAPIDRDRTAEVLRRMALAALTHVA